MTYIFLAGPAFFVLSALILGWLTPNYRPADTTISEYVLVTKYGVLQTLNFVLSGILIVMLGWSILGRHFSAYGASSVLLFGLVLLLSGIFKTDPVNTQHRTASGAVHNLVFLAGLLTVISGEFVTGIAKHTSVFGIFSLVSGVLSVVCAVALFYFFGKKHYKGLAQRALVVTMFTWFTALALAAGI